MRSEKDVITHQQACEILLHTDDGDLLPTEELALLETVVNCGVGVLTELGHSLWREMHSGALSGKYKTPSWLHGQEHLTKDQEGHVRWKGISIEHYSFKDRAEEAVAAHELARVCATIESRGLPMTWASCSQIYDEARFGQGIESPRMHVFWTFSDTRCDLTVIPESSADVGEAAVNGQRHAQQLNETWNCPDGALRRALVVSKESLLECERSIRSDSAWAQAVLRSSTEACQMVEKKLSFQMTSALAGKFLPTQKTLAEQVLAQKQEERMDSSGDLPERAEA